MAKTLDQRLAAAKLIKDETIPNANTAPRVGGAMEDINNAWNEELGEINVTTAFPPTSGYHTPETARAAVPDSYKRKGRTISYQTASGTWVKEQYRGDSTAAWATASNWFPILMAADQNVYNVTTQNPLAAGEYYNPTTARAAVPNQIRKLNLGLKYLSGYKEVDTLTITGPALTDGSISIFLNGVKNTASPVIYAGDTAIDIATKIRLMTWAGWTVGGTPGTAVVTFTRTTYDPVSAPTFSSTAGITANFVRTSTGQTPEWTHEEFIGPSTASWTTAANWRKLATATDLAQIETDLNKNISAKYTDWGLIFNGTSSYLRLKNPIILQSEGDYIEFICKPISLAPSKYSLAGNKSKSIIGVGKSSSNGVTVRTDDNVWIFGVTINLTPGITTTYIKVKLVYTFNSIQLYYNDRLVAESTTVGKITLEYFGNNYSTNFWEGTLYNVKWKSAGIEKSYANLLSAEVIAVKDLDFEKQIGLSVLDSSRIGLMPKNIIASFNRNENRGSFEPKNPITLSAVGDYIELYIRVNPEVVGNETSQFLLSSSYSGFNMGYYNNSIYFRQYTGANYDILQFPSEFNSVEKRKRLHVLKIVLADSGYEFYINGILCGTATKTNNIEINKIANEVSTSVSKYGIGYVKYSTLISGQDIIPANILASIGNKVILEDILEEDVIKLQNIEFSITNPNCFVSYVKDSYFKVYLKDKTSNNIYYSFTIQLNSSLNTEVDEIFYKHHWEIVSGEIYTYDGVSMSKNGLILAGGESECVFMNVGANGETKADHTGGVHGDERIDVSPESFVKFYIDGVRLSDSELLNSFELRSCNKFAYIQNSTMHDTANEVINKETTLDAVGAGILSINTSQNFEIDGVDTGIKAYAQNSLLTTVDGLTVGVSSNNKWTISNVIEVVIGHPVIATHIKKTEFENCGYKTFNRITFNQVRNVPYWYHGICCVSKDCASVAFNENFIDQDFNGSNGSNLLSSVGNREFHCFNVTKKQSANITSKLLKGVDDSLCTMFVWDRALDSKYYRKTPPIQTTIGLVVESEMAAAFDSIG